MKRYVCGFLFDKKGKRVVLIKKKRPDWQKGFLNGVGGHIEATETPKQAMSREFKEETGMDVQDWQETVILQGVNDTLSIDYTVQFFRAFGDVNKVRTTTDEKVKVCKIKKLRKVIPNLRWLIPLSLENIAFRVVVNTDENPKRRESWKTKSTFVKLSKQKTKILTGLPSEETLGKIGD